MSTVGAALAAVGMTLVVRGVRRAVRWTGGSTAVVRPRTAVRSRLSQVAVGGLLAVTVASCTTAQEIDTSHGSVTEMLQARQFREPVPSLSTADRTAPCRCSPGNAPRAVASPTYSAPTTTYNGR
ncbi:hypothetical protein ACR6C2_40940 [Streptomyces sp. INA 01156]